MFFSQLHWYSTCCDIVYKHEEMKNNQTRKTRYSIIWEQRKNMIEKIEEELYYLRLVMKPDWSYRQQ